jgi:hypothetical protein
MKKILLSLMLAFAIVAGSAQSVSAAVVIAPYDRTYSWLLPSGKLLIYTQTWQKKTETKKATRYVPINYKAFNSTDPNCKVVRVDADFRNGNTGELVQRVGSNHLMVHTARGRFTTGDYLTAAQKPYVQVKVTMKNPNNPSSPTDPCSFPFHGSIDHT